jgi:hypothetical protein
VALVELYDKIGLVINPFGHFPDMPLLGSNTANAVGESIGFIGRMYLTSGIGTSKTISSAGGKIWFVAGSVIWSTAGTTIRVGIQDVNLTNGLEDGIYDAFGELVQGIDSLPNGSIKETNISSGSKTITHGDMVAVVLEMTVRSGSDSLTALRPSINNNFPYTTADAGVLGKATTGMPWCAVQFDDGTIGHFGNYTIPMSSTEPLISVSTIPDEYALVFQLPFKCTVNGLFLRIGDMDPADDGDAHLIRDPFGTVTDLATVVMTAGPQAQSGSQVGSTIVDIPETEILANTDYAVSYRATTAGTRSVKLWTLAHANLRLALPMQVSGASRADGGAFINSNTIIPEFGIRINKIDVSSGSSTVETSSAYIG